MMDQLTVANAFDIKARIIILTGLYRVLLGEKEFVCICGGI